MLFCYAAETCQLNAHGGLLLSPPRRGGLSETAGRLGSSYWRDERSWQWQRTVPIQSRNGCIPRREDLFTRSVGCLALPGPTFSNGEASNSVRTIMV